MAGKKQNAKRTTQRKRAVPKTTTAKPSAKKKTTTRCAAVTKPAPKKPATTRTTNVRSNIFEGATEIALTEKKIAVTRSVSKSTNGKYSEKTTREYYDRTPTNMRAFDAVLNNRSPKKITVKLK